MTHRNKDGAQLDQIALTDWLKRFVLKAAQLNQMVSPLVSKGEVLNGP